MAYSIFLYCALSVVISVLMSCMCLHFNVDVLLLFSCRCVEPKGHFQTIKLHRESWFHRVCSWSVLFAILNWIFVLVSFSVEIYLGYL